MLTDRRQLERAITGALRATIRDHGPITADHIGSAAKRILGQLRNTAAPPAQPTPPRPRGPGRPALGHEGHPGPAASCSACALQHWRKARGLTQAEAARKIPSGRSYHTGLRTYVEWERAERPVPVLVLEYLRRLYALDSSIK